MSQDFWDLFFRNGDNHGRYWRTSQKNQSSSPQQPNSCAGGAGTAGAYQRAIAAHYAYKSARKSARLDWDLYWDVPTRTKWAPPWMSGDLGKPNAAKTWIPHQVNHMTSEGIKAGEVIAWRAWYWDPKRKRLRSIFVDYEWPINGEPAVGQPDKGYGIHAFKTLPRVLNEYFGCLPDLYVGEVALWGDIVEFQHGYTAEYAKAYKIYPFDFTKKLNREVMELYSLRDV